MRMKKICFVFFIAITCIGFYPLGIVQALNFADWSPIWFKVKVSETGKAGIVVSPITPTEVKWSQTTKRHILHISTWGTYVDSSFSVNYCTFNGTRWELQEGLPMEVVGGEPEKFLTLFNFNRRQSQNITEQYWVAIEVKGKEASNTIGDINSASFKRPGGHLSRGDRHSGCYPARYWKREIHRVFNQRYRRSRKYSARMLHIPDSVFYGLTWGGRYGVMSSAECRG